MSQMLHRGSITRSRSICSQHTRNSGFLDIEEMGDAELIRAVQELKREIRVTALENDILERTIMRLDPSLMNNIQQAIDYAVKVALGSTPSTMMAGSFIRSQTSRFDMGAASKILSSPSRMSTKRLESSPKLTGTTILGSGVRINVMCRAELVSNEIESVMHKLENVKKNAANRHAILKAQLEEIELRVAEVEKASEAFHQEVIVEGYDKLAQRIPAEIWIRYLTEWIKITDSQIGKLRLRTSTLNAQYIKYKGQIKVKAELSDQLRPVDFDKIKIENQEAIATIDRKTKQLQELKKMTGDANLNLTVHKKAMWEQNSYLEKILANIKLKGEQMVILDKEKAVIQAEADDLATRLTEVKKVRNMYEVPDIMDYVRVKAALGELQRSTKLLENRLRIQQIALGSLQSKLRTMNA